MAQCWRPPGYAGRAAEAFKAARPDGNQTLFAEANKFKGYQVGRWLKALPGNHEDLVRFAAALGVSWQSLVIGPLKKKTERRAPRAPAAIRAVPSRRAGGPEDRAS